MAAHQAPLSLGFSRQERWSGLPFPVREADSPVNLWKYFWVCLDHSAHRPCPRYVLLEDPTHPIRAWDLPSWGRSVSPSEGAVSHGWGTHTTQRSRDISHFICWSLSLPLRNVQFSIWNHWKQNRLCCTFEPLKKNKCSYFVGCVKRCITSGLTLWAAPVWEVAWGLKKSRQPRPFLGGTDWTHRQSLNWGWRQRAPSSFWALLVVGPGAEWEKGFLCGWW